MKELRNEEMKNKTVERKKLKVTRKRKSIILTAEKLSPINAVQPFIPWQMPGCSA